MSKKLLLASASIIIFSTSIHAEGDTLVDLHSAQELAHIGKMTEMAISTTMTENPLAESVVAEVGSRNLPAALIVDFAQFSYSVDKTNGWKQSDKELYNKLINDGWKLDTFNGTTGTAQNQVESVSGLLAFKDDQVVIATRGTEMTNWNDWMTNFRFSRSPITRFFSSDESNKLGAITAQFFGGVEGEVANGFLQTHLSSWEYIKAAIIKYAASIGKTTQELHYTITGHSKGAAKAQLNALNLLTDSTLGIGVDYLEKSFIFSNSNDELDLTASQADIFGSGFYGISWKTEPENNGNVETVVFESPNVFDKTAATKFDTINGKDNLIRIENEASYDIKPTTTVSSADYSTQSESESSDYFGKQLIDGVKYVGSTIYSGVSSFLNVITYPISAALNSIDVDPVTKVAPTILGFEPAGTKVAVNGKGTLVTRHMMGNVKDVAIPAIEEHRANVAKKEISDNTTLTAAATSADAPGTVSVKAEQGIDNLGKSSVAVDVKSSDSSISNSIKSAWNYLWG